MPRLDITKDWTRGQGGAAADPTRGADLELSTPTRPAGFISDLVVPLGQALITGAFLAGLVIFALSELAPGWEVNRLKLWGALALAISAVTWFVLLVDTRRLLREVEKLTGLDLDRDGQVGERVVIVNADQEQQKAVQEQGTARASQFALFVARLPSKGSDLRSWEKELGREVYQEYRDVLIRLGWARWRSLKDDGTPNERQGWELVKPASEILERISG